ncbi:MAG: sigma-54-dependent Fis family transcriptional regulator [Nitrospirales bacterium]|nr:sigma-54-dependent Fis family transcriptional regulator [Nitrospirales bacterium]
MKRKILLIEDDPIMRLGMSHFLKAQGFEITTCDDGEAGISAIEKASYHLVVTDLRLPKKDGFEVFRRAKEVSPTAGFIIITGHPDIKGAVQAIKEGAFDYLAKPFSNDELLIAVERFFKFQRLEEEVVYLKEAQRSAFEEIIGVGTAMRDVFDRISSVAEADVPVLIQGESGTGKEMVANAIHRLSKRKEMPFVKINCAAIPENLFESEIFGHEKGAFTGAVSLRKGKFEFADGGTIFFDEAGDFPPQLQPKLLRVLEEHQITRLGGNLPIPVDVRGIYATSKSLKEEVAAGRFREDLYYRINVVPVTLPPLRERREDIPHLIDHFLRQFMEKFRKPDLAFSPAAYEALLSYRYPGNVRELKHAVERAVVLTRTSTIDIKTLPEEILSEMRTPVLSSRQDQRLEPVVSDTLSLEESLKSVERKRIVDALRESEGRKIEAASRLGISRKVLWKKLKEYGID